MCHVNTAPLSDTITVLLIKGRQLIWRVFIILDSLDKANGWWHVGQTRMTLFRGSFLKINTQYTLVLSEWADCDKRCIIVIRQVSVSAVMAHLLPAITVITIRLSDWQLCWSSRPGVFKVGSGDPRGPQGSARGPWTSLVKSSLKI